MLTSLFMLEPQTNPMDDIRIKMIMRNNPRVGRSLASRLSMPTILSPKKIKKEDLIEGDMPMESHSSEGIELQGEPLPPSSTPLHGSSTMKVLLTYLV